MNPMIPVHPPMTAFELILSGGSFAIGATYVIVGLLMSLIATAVCGTFHWGRPPSTDDEAIFAIVTVVLFWPLLAIPFVPLFAFIVARGLLWNLPRRFVRGMFSLLFGAS